MAEVPGEMTLDELNRLPAPVASQALSMVCSSERWVGAVLAGRPYQTLDALIGRSDAAVGAMTEADLRAALNGHPRIGDARAASGGWSGQEQAGVAVGDAELMRALAVGNTAYEQRFGHTYLVCATGRSGRELLELLLDRLRNDRATEWRVVAAELGKINQIRLRKLVKDVPAEKPFAAAPPAPVRVSTHVLDAAKGEPAGGVVVRLERDGRELGRGKTDGDGRISDFGAGQLSAGVYRLVFETQAYLGAGEAFFPEVVVTFRVDGRRAKYHVPLLLSPYSYSTYRGS
jgi:2-oxo-4-hydroxy-4-carboxy-5-ureidoimidazoline decarboxylase